MRLYLLYGYNSKYYNLQQKRIELLKKIICKNDLCFDVGANNGHVTHAMLEVGADVVCFEPLLDFVKNLHREFLYESRVKIVPYALGSKEGISILNLSKEASALASMSDKWVSEGRFSENNFGFRYKVPVISLEYAISTYGTPKFIKINVEGFEKNVIEGLFEPIEFISFEYSKEFSIDSLYIMEYLLKLSNYKFNFSLAETWSFMFSSWMDADKLIDKLSFIDDKLLWGDIYARLEK